MKWLHSRRANRGGDVLGINRRNIDHVFEGYRPGKFRDLDDKLRCKERLVAQGIPVPRTLLVVSSRAGMHELRELLATRDEMVVKPARGSRGRGILVLRRVGDSWQTPGGRVLDEAAILDHARDVIAGHFSLDEAPDEVFVEPRIHPHRWLRSLYPGGLSDIRIVVEDGEPLQAMLRVPTALSDGKANLHEGGIGIGIDLVSGRTVHAVQNGRVVSRHPDTEEELIGKEVPEFAACLDVARAVARTFGEIRYLGIDLVLDRELGVLVLEVNARPGLAIQIANRQGQPVRPRDARSGFERVTEWTSWVVLALLALAPAAFGLWHESTEPVIEPVRVAALHSADQTEDDWPGSGGGVEWSDSSEPVSSRSDLFAAALTAVADGDTTRALTIYEESAGDEEVRPFALNNMALIHRARGDLSTAATLLEQAVEVYPSYARGHYNLGLVRRDLGDRSQARASFTRAVELRPSHARSWSRLGELDLQEGDYESAVDAFERAIRFDPDAVSDRTRLGVALMAMGRPGEAARRYEEALALRPGSWRAELGYLEARLAQAAGSQTPVAPATLDSLDARYRDVRPRRPEEFAPVGAEISWWKGNPSEGLKRLDAVPDGDLSLEALQLRTLLELEIGAFEAVLAHEAAPDRQRWRDLARWGRHLDRRTRGLEEDVPAPIPHIDPVVRLLALRVLDQEAPAEAVRAARDAALDETELRWIDALEGGDFTGHVPTVVRWSRSKGVPLPTSVLVWSHSVLGSDGAGADDESLEAFIPSLRDRLRREIDAGDVDAAHETGLLLLHNAPGDVDVLIALVGVELARGDLGFARTLVSEISPSGRRRPDARIVEARLLLAEGRRRAARGAVTDLLDQNPADVEALEVLAAIQFAEDDVADAVATLRTALTLEPGRTDIRERLARGLMRARLYPEAEQEWMRLVGLDTDEGGRRSALFNLALSVQRQGRDTEAIPIWSRLLEEQPDHTRARYNLALAYERSGRLAEAVAEYRRVLELDPGHEPSRERLLQLGLSPSGDPR